MTIRLSPGVANPYCSGKRAAFAKMAICECLRRHGKPRLEV